MNSLPLNIIESLGVRVNVYGKPIALTNIEEATSFGVL